MYLYLFINSFVILMIYIHYFNFLRVYSWAEIELKEKEGKKAL